MNVPKIRFKGFEGEWKTASITDVAFLKAGKSFNKNDVIEELKTGYYPCFGGNGHRGFLPYYNQEGKYNIIGRQGALCGCINVAEGKFYATEHAVLVTPIIETDFGFLHESLVRANINQFATGAAQPGISVANVNAQLSLVMPSAKEQNLIGKYFTHLDSLISASTSRLASLKQVKEASLQAMFPQEGETVPKIRFKGFEGEWRKVKAEEIFKTINERNFPELPVLSATQDKGMVTRDSIGYNIFHDKSNEATYKHILPGQFVIHLRSFQGGFAHSSIEGICSPAYTIMDFKDRATNDDIYWKYVLTSKPFIKSLELITYGIRDGRSISFDEFKEMKFLVPQIKEQRAIASYFTVLDRRITLQTQRLEKLKQIKAACLDKMFV